MSETIRVGIIDDDPLVREEFIFLLQSQGNAFELTFEAASIGQFFEVLQMDDRPDIVLLDISLAGQNSLGQIGKLRKLLPEARIIIITGHTDPELLKKALREGAHGYFVKSSRPERILEVIRATHEGGAFIEPQMASAILDIFRQPAPQEKRQEASVRERLEGLGQALHPREIQVAEGLARGMAYKEIATDNNIGLNTVRHYVKSLYKKLGISSKLELLRLLEEDT